jgi:nitrogen fixation NifU-like protein
MDLNELYQDLIIEHSKQPQNFGVLDSATSSACGNNPLCGDKLKVSVCEKDGVISDIKFEGSGCAISVASASLMSEHLKGKTKEAALRLFNLFQAVVRGEKSAKESEAELGDLSALAGVRNFPVRVKCATLAWHTLKAALEQPSAVVSTEK